ncbi:FtsJ-domain-containing protein [Vararia minispora EC-137]|uniref:FtsJ-domain-containing protein n=1 Tax=Vararia minispora EC-137 TaxID=1314806 RepID=A0ACB8QS69_9AGAM|nr:FtsJ-domain-containing protein [Vararia minispora EC-137]
MGKAQKKTGKGRLDKYYKLAKEQGYRARSAFKLIQLNKKYSFLESARCCIDLCAAPGGWLQVASKYMPANSLIVGVDLVPIKPIPRVSTFAADITTSHCRNLLRGELKDWKADVVLHDGAPNVGTAWVQDAYSQSELVLMSLKLAVEFLAKGGTFVTKVFRSVDYNNLIWVFSQLFGKVEATKPPSSRNVSAEIFVVCRDFHAPKQVDPKFLDPKHVFKDLAVSASTDKGSNSANAQLNVFQPEKKRRKRDGYEDGNYTLFKSVGVSEFVRSSDPVSILGSVNQMTFDTDEEKQWASLDITSADVKVNLDDLKVLGKGDFKALLRWRTKLREDIGLEGKAEEDDDGNEEVVEIANVDEEQQIQDELERLNAEATARSKRDRRKANEVRQRTIQRMQLQMTAPMDIGLDQRDSVLAGDEDIFDLGEAERDMRRNGAARFARGDAVETDEDEDELPSGEGSEEVLDSEDELEKRTRALEDDIDDLYSAYRERLAERDAKFKVKEARKKDKVREEEWHGIGAAQDSGEDDSEEEQEGGWDKVQNSKVQDENSSSDEDSSDEDKEPPSIGHKRARLLGDDANRRKKARLVTDLGAMAHNSRATDLWFSQDVFSGAGDVANIEDSEEDEDQGMLSIGGDSISSGSNMPETPTEDEDDFEVVPQEPDDATMWDADDKNEDEVKQALVKSRGLLTAEAVTLAQQLVNRQKTKTELLNDGFTRYSLNSKEDLPAWFLDDESKYYKANIPVTKEAIAALRAKQRALDARPIKKIAEAKARKKFKAAQKLERALRKAEGITQTDELTEREKAKQVEKLLHKGLSKGKKKEVELVVAKGAHKGIKGRPKGVKGRYTMVDARMKKEVRAKKRKEKENKKRRRV